MKKNIFLRQKIAKLVISVWGVDSPTTKYELGLTYFSICPSLFIVDRQYLKTPSGMMGRVATVLVTKIAKLSPSSNSS